MKNNDIECQGCFISCKRERAESPIEKKCVVFEGSIEAPSGKVLGRIGEVRFVKVKEANAMWNSFGTLEVEPSDPFKNKLRWNYDDMTGALTIWNELR